MAFIPLRAAPGQGVLTLAPSPGLDRLQAMVMAAADEFAHQRPRYAHCLRNILLRHAIDAMEAERPVDALGQFPHRRLDDPQRLAAFDRGSRTRPAGRRAPISFLVRCEDLVLEAEPPRPVDREVAHHAHEVALRGLDPCRNLAPQDAQHHVLHHILGEKAATDMAPRLRDENGAHRLSFRKKSICLQIGQRSKNIDASVCQHIHLASRRFFPEIQSTH